MELHMNNPIKRAYKVFMLGKKPLGGIYGYGNMYRFDYKNSGAVEYQRLYDSLNKCQLLLLKMFIWIDKKLTVIIL